MHRKNKVYSLLKYCGFFISFLFIFCGSISYACLYSDFIKVDDDIYCHKGQVI